MYDMRVCSLRVVHANGSRLKIADHSETSDNMGQGMAEREPGNVANGVKNLFDL